MIIYRLCPDIGQSGSAGSIRVPQNDLNSRRVELHFMQNGEPYTPAATCTAVWEASLPGGAMLYIDCTLEDGKVLHTITGAETQLAGRANCRCVLYDGNGSVLSSPAIELAVESAVVSDASVAATSDFTALQTAMTQANSFKTKWQNPSVTVTTLSPSATATGSCTLGNNGVAFAFGIPKGETGQPAYIGSETGCLVETATGGVLSAGRKIRVGTADPSEDTALRDGDLYVQILPKQIVLFSSTVGSDKRFAITVNDSGVLTATEV